MRRPAASRWPTPRRSTTSSRSQGEERRAPETLKYVAPSSRSARLFHHEDELWRRIGARAAKQWGHVTRDQLLEVGFTPARVGRWVQSGKLISVHAGVYAVGHPRAESMAR